jgi:hypothetical protein
MGAIIKTKKGDRFILVNKSVPFFTEANQALSQKSLAIEVKVSGRFPFEQFT